jgi:hypothetical protein
VRLQIDIYEDESPEPILSHVFYGHSPLKIQAVVAAHMQTDSFFKAAMTTKQFRGMVLRTQEQWLM